MSQRMKIASLEDDLDQAQHIQQVLSAAGYTCTSYPRSLDLLAALRVQAFDLILLDWQLPDMNGDEVVRRLRTSYGFAVPIIFLTSRDQESDLVQGLQAGADDYIVKPMRPAELLARVAALLRRSQGALPDYLPFSVAGAIASIPTSAPSPSTARSYRCRPRNSNSRSCFFATSGA
ncbi:response regulator receiver domain protein [Bordetella pertussis H918]|uniref:Response regulator receiver domain protein n=2 Tax=Bordetella pertussis TaxID=520 RepID=A0AAI9J153_BORPT|nr:response regulator receiver domain protein [Bordetella pertussis CHLA-11]ETH02140.1 response regulator receiver domain protein [Bordetella pertussis 2250905]ETH04789.1 response regulator receiver domain protein [Bordetella pertussis 2356847]ETH07056.1 response regulator receiver domain protein [Bordetella pertussis 2371640]ETH11364.1 response regulator receiver domain protein [Bordetella pertussis STO1-SEAT-0006]ETH20423.1 response regulator receiver domain protein [Bordetella pertussis CHL